MSVLEINEFIHTQRIGRVGCHVDGVTYVVPVIFAWDTDSFYIYTTEGQKITMMRRNPNVCFEIDEYQSSGSWRSVIVQGFYEELRGDDAARTLELLMERVPPSSGTRRDSTDRGEGRVP